MLKFFGVVQEFFGVFLAAGRLRKDFKPILGFGSFTENFLTENDVSKNGVFGFKQNTHLSLMMDKN